MKAVFIYVTAPSEDVARLIADRLVSEKLAACANILPGMTSVYRWQGEIEQSKETVLILKTRADLFASVEQRIKKLHPYDAPCIVALPIEMAHVPFLKWLEHETSD